MGDEDPGLGTFDGFLPIPCQSAATPGPGEGTFHDPSAGQQLKTFGSVRAFHDPDRPAPGPDQGGA